MSALDGERATRDYLEEERARAKIEALEKRVKVLDRALGLACAASTYWPVEKVKAYYISEAESEQ